MVDNGSIQLLQRPARLPQPIPAQRHSQRRVGIRRRRDKRLGRNPRHPSGNHQRAGPRVRQLDQRPVERRQQRLRQLLYGSPVSRPYQERRSGNKGTRRQGAPRAAPHLPHSHGLLQRLGRDMQRGALRCRPPHRCRGHSAAAQRRLGAAHTPGFRHPHPRGRRKRREDDDRGRRFIVAEGTARDFASRRHTQLCRRSGVGRLRPRLCGRRERRIQRCDNRPESRRQPHSGRAYSGSRGKGAQCRLRGVCGRSEQERRTGLRGLRPCLPRPAVRTRRRDRGPRRRQSTHNRGKCERKRRGNAVGKESTGHCPGLVPRLGSRQLHSRCSFRQGQPLGQAALHIPCGTCR